MNPPLTSAENYKPRTGGNADRAIMHLRANGRTTHHALADAIDVDPDTLYASLSIPIRLGVIQRAKDQLKGTISYYVVAKPGDAILLDGGIVSDQVDGDTLVADTDPPDHAEVEKVISRHKSARAPLGTAQVEPVELATPLNGLEVFELPAYLGEPAEPPEPPPSPAPAAPSEPETVHAVEEDAAPILAKGFRCAYYSDRQFVIMDDGHITVLDAEKTKKLFDYIRQTLYRDAGSGAL